jgi:hypothetical protein
MEIKLGRRGWRILNMGGGELLPVRYDAMTTEDQ